MHHGRNRRKFTPIVLLVAFVASPAFAAPPPSPASSPPKAPPRTTFPPLTADALDQSLALGQQYLLNVQRPDGSFIYELDAARFSGLIEWLDQFTRAASWQRRLDALETEVYRTRRERRQHGATDQRQENTA